MMRTSPLFLLLIMLFTACSGPSQAPYVEVTDLLVVNPPVGRNIAVAYMNITAHGGNYRLVSAASPDAGKLELHASGMKDGRMMMRRQEELEIAAGETVRLEQGGYHLMLFDWDTAMKPGDTAEMQLIFIGPDGEELSLTLPAQVQSLS